MEYVIRFAISLFDLAVFMYYFHSNKKMKPDQRYGYGLDLPLLQLYGHLSVA